MGETPTGKGVSRATFLRMGGVLVGTTLTGGAAGTATAQASGVSNAAVRNLRVFSPDKKTKVFLRVDKAGAPSYRINYLDRVVIGTSFLGLRLRDAEPLSSGFTVEDVELDSEATSWMPLWGQSSKVVDRHNQMVVKLQERSGARRRLDLVFRVYDDGVGFRYRVPEQANLADFVITAEDTQFRLDGDHVAWWPSEFKGQARGTVIHGPAPVSTAGLAYTPVTMKAAEDLYLSIHEAALADSANMNLASSQDGSYVLESRSDGDTEASTPYVTPWRTIQIGQRPGDLIESSLLLNLNEPDSLADAALWVAPGKATWDWRNRGATADDGFVYGLDHASFERLIDFSSSHNIQYFMIDAGWYGRESDPKMDPTRPIPGLDIAYLADYGRQRGVGLMLYINTIHLKNYDLDRTFSTYRDWGVAGIKHGFLNNATQAGVELDLEVARKTAEYRLMYDCHEAIKPTGIHRTYPHFLSREYDKSLADGAAASYATPTYHATLPFVNMLGGPLDATPGMFDLNKVTERERVQASLQTTVTAQAARCLVIFTGLLVLPDHGDSYMKKADLFDFIESLPIGEWDETRVVNGEIGEFVTIARRKGNDWFVGSTTDESARTLTIPMTFLGPGSHHATIYADAPDADYRTNQEAYQVTEQVVEPSDVIRARLAPGGGHAMKITGGSGRP